MRKKKKKMMRKRKKEKEKNYIYEKKKNMSCVKIKESELPGSLKCIKNFKAS
jgi:hypothetical protein